MDTLVLHIPNKIEALQRLQESLRGLGKKWELTNALIMNLELVLEEIVSNIIFYGFEDEREHTIEVDFRKLEHEILIRISDDGIPFDLTAVESFHDQDKTAEEREIGGLGIHFVKTLVDRIEYRRDQNKNILTLHKTINNQP